MPVFVIEGTKAGAPFKGEKSAASKDALQAVLTRERIVATNIKEKKAPFDFSFGFGGGVSAKELSIFTRQFSVMIDAGLPLVQCLEILGSQQDNANFKTALLGVRAGVEGGMTLAAAMRAYPKAFDDLYVNMVEAGETGGILDGILQRLATHIEKNVRLTAAVKSAMIMPAIVMTVMVLVIVLILWKVVPVFTTLFTSMGAALPTPTKIVINMSDVMVFMLGKIWFITFPALFGAFVGFRALLATPQGRYFFDSLTLKFPLIGTVMRKITVARFTRTLGTLLQSGVPILEALNITAKTSGNAVVEEALLRVRKGIEEGKTMSDPLKATGVFPSMVTQMVGVGEQTGALDAMLAKIADFYDEEVDQAVHNMLVAMEPIILVILGVCVGGIVIAMYLPLFALIGQMS